MDHIAKIFMNGHIQAVPLPKESHFESDEVFIRKRGDEVVISPKIRRWDDFFDRKPVFDESFFADSNQLPAQERDF